MGRSIAFSDVRESIRVRYDLPAFSSTTFVTTTAVNALINASLQAYYGLLLECYGDNYFATSETLTTVASIPLTSLPVRFMKLIALHWQRDSATFEKMKPATVDDIQIADRGAVSWAQYCPRYRLSGLSSLEWFPTPGAAYSVRCDFVRLPEDLVDDTDFFEAGNGWEEWVIADVCRKIAEREEKDDKADRYMGKRNEAEGRIRAQAPERDEGEAVQLRDTWGDDYRGVDFDRLEYYRS